MDIKKLYAEKELERVPQHSTLVRKTRLISIAIKAVMLLVLVGSLFGYSVQASPRVHAASLDPTPVTSNPFSGPPNCTWWAWQHLHDTAGIDLQVTGNAGDWANELQNDGAFAAWSESSQSWVQVQLNTQPMSIGDIVVVPQGDKKYAFTNDGHVAFVEQIGNDGTFQASAQDYNPPRDTYSTTWNTQDLQAHQNGGARFIHIIGGTSGGNSGPVSIPTNEAGHVMAATADNVVLDSNGNRIPARCNGTNVGGNAVLPAGFDVVILDDSKSYQLNGRTYVYVAMPDWCEPNLDFSDPSAVADGTGAVAYAPLDALSEIYSVQPSVSGADWRDGWDPTSGSQDASYSGGPLQSKDANLYAWWNGSAWQPRWWHVVDSNGNDASVYGRDWMKAS